MEDREAREKNIPFSRTSPLDLMVELDENIRNALNTEIENIIILSAVILILKYLNYNKLILEKKSGIRKLFEV